MTSRQRWVLALTSVASLMVALDILVVTTALNTIRVDLGASVAALEWTVNAYSLSFAVLLMTASVTGWATGGCSSVVSPCSARRRLPAP
jgi:MFS family permease